MLGKFRPNCSFINTTGKLGDKLLSHLTIVIPASLYGSENIPRTFELLDVFSKSHGRNYNPYAELKRMSQFVKIMGYML